MSEKLRAENYGIPVGEPVTYQGHRRNGFYGSEKATWKKSYEMVNDNEDLNIRQGDLVYVDNSRHKKLGYGVVLDRYRIVKDKGVTYRDYFSIVMMITGEKKGKVYKMGQGLQVIRKTGVAGIMKQFLDGIDFLDILGVTTFSDVAEIEIRETMKSLFQKHGLTEIENE